MSNTETADDKAKVLLSKLMAGKEVHQIFSQHMKEELLINGKQMHLWEDHFKINIPTDSLTPSMCKELSMRLMNLKKTERSNGWLRRWWSGQITLELLAP